MDYTPSRQGGKRKRDPDDDGDEDERGRTNNLSNQADQTYCYCDGISSDEMVACDGDHCARDMVPPGISRSRETTEEPSLIL